MRVSSHTRGNLLRDFLAGIEVIDKGCDGSDNHRLVITTKNLIQKFAAVRSESENGSGDKC